MIAFSLNESFSVCERITSFIGPALVDCDIATLDNALSLELAVSDKITVDSSLKCSRAEVLLPVELSIIISEGVI